jgi:predicted protein tyrosine phosphatase
MSMNRLWNIRNPHQGRATKILAVCSAGLLRSPTIAKVLTKDFEKVNCRSAGVSEEYALIPVDQVLVQWADVIICADKDHADWIEDTFRDMEFGADTTPLIVLGIPDVFGFSHPRLEELIREKIKALQDDGVLKLE